MTCPGWPERFFASGEERTRVAFPAGHGYLWDDRPPATGGAPAWILAAHLDGLHQGHTTTAFIRLDLGFTPRTEGTLTRVTPVWLDVRNCSTDPLFDVRAGSGRAGVARERWTYEMPVGGRFVAMAGHLHDGGIALALTNTTTRTPVFTSRTVYGSGLGGARLAGMTSFSRARGPRVAAGDVLRLTAAYDSTRRRTGAMGIMVGGLAASP